MNKSIAELSRDCAQDPMVGLRRRMHALPELSLQAQGTSQLVQAELTAMRTPFEVVREWPLATTSRLAPRAWAAMAPIRTPASTRLHVGYALNCFKTL